MGLFNPFSWTTRDTARALAGRGVRHTQVEQLEKRELLAADVLLGGVYYEEATGDDTEADILQVSFEGGAAGTVLNRLVISGDKLGDGLSSGDTFFDIDPGGIGAFDPVGLTILSSDGFTVTSVAVADGSTDIVFEFSGFEAGEKLVFSIDVDEAQLVNPATGDVVLQNSLVEGGEFELNTLTGEFSAPGYVDLTLGGVYYDAFDDERVAAESATTLELDLPDDIYDTTDSQIDRTAGAVAHVAQLELATLSGYVYHDKNDDGVFDPAESPIEGVELKLLKDGVDTERTATTGPNGFYEFKDLEPGKYTVMENQPAGWYDGKDTPGTHGGDASVNDMIAEIMLDYGDHSLDNNFGELLGGSIAGRVHASSTPECDFDNPEVLLEGVTIELLDASGAVIDTTQTDADGRYKFANLRPGQYSVREVQPTSHEGRPLFDGGERVGSAGGVLSDDLVNQIVIGSEQDAVDYDFCEHFGATLSGYVYHDRDNDGVFDPGEDPIEQVELRLFKDGVDTGRTAATDPTGFYEFTDLAPGKYTVVETQPAGWYDGKDTPGTLGGDASVNDTIAEVMLTFGDNSQQNNFGELLGGSIAGRVHASSTPDCDFDNPEILLQGVTIELLDASGNVIDSTQTDADGRYKFDDLAPGEYQVREVQPTSYAGRPLYDGDEHVGTAGGVLADDLVSQIIIGSEQDAVEYDFCEHLGAAISGYVYHDQNDDGAFDPSEDPIAGVTIKLLDESGATIDTINTDGDGYYEFTDLGPGKYTVMEVQPAAWFDGKDTPGTLGGDASVNDMIAMVMLTYGDHSQQNNFGELLGASIAGRVHASTDPDCDFDDPEVLLEGVTIELLDADGNVIDTTETDADGRYKFEGLAPGEYQVREVQPTSYNGQALFDGDEHIGTAGGVASDDLLSGIVLGSGEDATRYDFCEHFGAMLSGYVYHDQNDDGVRDPAEDPIAGVTVKLLKDGVDTGRVAVTDATGLYKFNDLGPGKYTVMEVQPDGWIDGKDTPGTLGGDASANDMIAMIMLNFGDVSEENNFGELLPGSIRGRVHAETDGDCIYEPGEELLAGVTIELLDADGNVIDSTQTDAQGEYEFTGLAPGVYSVREVQPEGYFNGGSVVGDGGGLSASKDLLSEVVIGSNQNWVNYDFCEMLPAQLSGFVFIDGAPITSLTELTPLEVAELRDGQRTADDTPLAGIVLELRNGISGDPIFGHQAVPGVYPDGPITTVTGPDGYYEFTGLPGGVYAVVEQQPEDLIDGVDTPGTLGGFAANATRPTPGIVLPVIVQQAVEQFRTQFGDNVILRIVLPVGQNSVENNFSEVRRQPFVPPPEDPRVDPPTPPVFAPPSVYIPPQLPPQAVAIDPPDPIYGGGSRALGWTWHLSVVNAGWPRAMRTTEATIMHQASSEMDASEWSRVALDRAEWLLMDDDTRDQQALSFLFGNRKGTPVSGDWDGDGDDDIGVFIAGHWYLDLNGNGRWDAGDLWAQLGSQEDLPVTGDWDGDGKTDIGIFGPAWPRDPHAIEREPGLPDAENYPTLIVDAQGLPMSKNLPPTPEDATSGARLLKKTINGEGRADLIDHVFHYGTPGDTPIAGDWNGDGIRNIGVYRDGAWQLDTNGDGRLSDLDESYRYGEPGDLPVVGDWNGDGKDELGVFRAGIWLVDTNGDHQLDAQDAAFELGGAGDKPIAGDWDGDGVDEPGVYSPQAPAPEGQISQAG